jgi:hypothetical protein
MCANLLPQDSSDFTAALQTAPAPVPGPGGVMPVETPSLFAQVIQEHLELRDRNSQLENRMPIDRYMSQDPFENHPLFKTEEQARIEDTIDGLEATEVVSVASSLAWPGEDAAVGEETEEGLWTRSRDFDWGD